jgi:hypothetical protein
VACLALGAAVNACGGGSTNSGVQVDEGGAPLGDGGGGVSEAGDAAADAPTGLGEPLSAFGAYAVQTVFLGETDRAGAPTKDAWKSYGENLDGLVTTKTDTAPEPTSTRARSVETEDRVDKEARHRAEHVGLEGRERAQLEREREDELANRHVRDDAVDEMRRGVRHAPAGATRACAALLARERDEQIVTAVIAPAVNEAVSEDTAAKVAAELLLDVARERPGVRLARPSQKGLEVVANDRVERRLRGPARCVGRREGRHGPRG